MHFVVMVDVSLLASVGQKRGHISNGSCTEHPPPLFFPPIFHLVKGVEKIPPPQKISEATEITLLSIPLLPVYALPLSIHGNRVGVSYSSSGRLPLLCIFISLCAFKISFTCLSAQQNSSIGLLFFRKSCNGPLSSMWRPRQLPSLPMPRAPPAVLSMWHTLSE